MKHDIICCVLAYLTTFVYFLSPVGDVRTCKCNLNYIAFRLISFTGIISDYCYLISTSFNIRVRTIISMYF